MLLNGKKFEITDVDGFFGVMDSYEKHVLSGDVEKSGVPVTEKYTVFVVSNHAVGLPRGAEKKLEPFIEYT